MMRTHPMSGYLEIAKKHLFALTLLVGALGPSPVAESARRAPAPAPTPVRCAFDVRPPLDVTLEPLDLPRPGAVTRFRVVATPRRLGGELNFRVVPAPAVEWVRGVRAQSRSARVDEEESLEFAVRVPRSGRHALHVEVELTDADGRRWRRGVGLGLGPNPRAESGRVRPDGHGGEVFEYEAAPASPGAKK